MKINIGIQKKGRLTDKSLEVMELLSEQKAQKMHPRLDYSSAKDFNLIFLRYGDIYNAIKKNYLQAGIVGIDTIMEKKDESIEYIPLGFGKCRIVIAVPEKSTIKNIYDLSDKTIATEFPVLIYDYLSKFNIDVQVLKVKGSTEVYAHFGFVDAVADIVETGSSLKAYNMRVLQEVSELEAVFIYRKDIGKNKLLNIINETFRPRKGSK